MPPRETRKRDAKAKAKVTPEDSEDEFNVSDDGSKNPKKRGRKRENWVKYVKEAYEKIKIHKEWLSTAKEKKIDVKVRQKWRNVVSAQQSRLNKKFEVIFLQNTLKQKNDSLEEL